MTFPHDMPHFEFESDTASSLAELLDTLLDKGLIVHGDVTLSVAGVDLVYVGVRALVSSVETAERYLNHQIGEAFQGDEKPKRSPASVGGAR